MWLVLTLPHHLNYHFLETLRLIMYTMNIELNVQTLSSYVWEQSQVLLGFTVHASVARATEPYIATCSS